MKFSPALVLMLLLGGCQRNPAPKPVQEYQMQGEVVSLDPTSQTATVKHGKIEGWMEPMTMEYPHYEQRKIVLIIPEGYKVRNPDEVLGVLELEDEKAKGDSPDGFE